MKPIYILILIISLAGLQNTQWKLAKNNKGIKVYTREYPNSDIKEFKAETVIKTDIKKLTALLNDVPKLNTWMENVLKAEVIKTEKNKRYIRFIIDFPWPFSDRDLVMVETKTISSDGTITYTDKNAPNAYPEQEDFVRMQKAEGKWILIPQKNGYVKVIYKFYGDPAGSIPNWLVNLFIVDGPYNTLLNMRKKVSE